MTKYALILNAKFYFYDEYYEEAKIGINKIDSEEATALDDFLAPLLSLKAIQPSDKSLRLKEIIFAFVHL